MEFKGVNFHLSLLIIVVHLNKKLFLKWMQDYMDVFNKYLASKVKKEDIPC